MADASSPASQGPDMIAQVGQMLQAISTGQWSNTFLEVQADDMVESDDVVEVREQIATLRQDERTIVLASAILAVAAELRAVRNELSDWQRAWTVRQ